MFGNARIEQTYNRIVGNEQRIVRQEVEIKYLGMKVTELEKDNKELHRQLNALKEALQDIDEFTGYLHGCANDNYDLINGLRDRIIVLEERKTLSGGAE